MFKMVAKTRCAHELGFHGETYISRVFKVCFFHRIMPWHPYRPFLMGYIWCQTPSDEESFSPCVVGVSVSYLHDRKLRGLFLRAEFCSRNCKAWERVLLALHMHRQFCPNLTAPWVLPVCPDSLTHWLTYWDHFPGEGSHSIYPKSRTSLWINAVLFIPAWDEQGVCVTDGRARHLEVFISGPVTSFPLF